MSRKGIGVATNVFTLSKTFIQVHNDNLFAHVHPVISNEEILFVLLYNKRMIYVRSENLKYFDQGVEKYHIYKR